jgi:hypothetical protein
MRDRQGGFAYLLLLFLVALLAISALAVGSLEYYASARSDEAELLRIGDEFRRGLASYHNAVEPRIYPATLGELVNDRRGGVLRRHLRKIYVDPVTRSSDWGLLIQAGSIIGVYSKSKRKPLKVAGFSPDDTAFEGAEHYSDWVFSPVKLVPEAVSITPPPRVNSERAAGF